MTIKSAKRLIYYNIDLYSKVSLTILPSCHIHTREVLSILEIYLMIGCLASPQTARLMAKSSPDLQLDISCLHICQKVSPSVPITYLSKSINLSSHYTFITITKIYANCSTVNMTNHTILQVCILYNIHRKVQEPKTWLWGGYDVLNLSNVNLDICTSPYNWRDIVMSKRHAKHL
jgi:hypothetical protein